MATSSSSTGSSKREGTAKAIVSDQISQAIQSTSNLLHLMQHSSHSQAQLIKLPRNLLAKTSTIRNTGHVLEQMPRVVSSLDAHMENCLQSVPHMQTIIQLLENMESSQLHSLSQIQLAQKSVGSCSALQTHDLDSATGHSIDGPSRSSSDQGQRVGWIASLCECFVLIWGVVHLLRRAIRFN